MPLYNAGNDVIHAFLAGQEEGRQAKALRMKGEQESAQLDQRRKEHEDALKQANDQFNAEMALKKAQAALVTAGHTQQIAKTFAESGIAPTGSTVTATPDTTSQQDFQSLNDQSFSHFDPATLQKVAGLVQGAQGPTVTNHLQLPNDLGTVDTPSPLDFAKSQADRQRILLQPQTQSKIDVATGVANAKLPGEMLLKTAELQNSQKIQEMKDTLATTLANTNNIAKEKVANIGAAARRYAADHQKSVNAPDPEELANVSQLVALGKMNNPTGANGIHVASILNKEGLVPLNTATSDKVKALGSLPTLFDDLTNFAEKNLSDSKGFGPWGTTLSSKIPQTEIANDLASIKVNAGPIARIFEGQTGRLAMQQINLAMDAMTSGSITKGEALKRISELKKKADSKLYNEVLAGVPEKQQEMIVSSLGLPYSFQSSAKAPATSKGGKVQTKQIKDPDNPGKMITVTSNDGGLRWTEQ